MPTIESFEAMLASGQDNALLRYSLGNEYLKAGDAQRAADQFAHAVKQDPKYSAAWKLYGKALTAAEQLEAAMAAYEKGIAAAEEKRDVQAAKEMGVFLKRLRKQVGAA